MSSTLLQERWTRPAGYRDVLKIGVPMVLSTSSWVVQSFVDRMFLCWYAPTAMAAAVPASITAFTIISFFIGTASYANTFVAQYHGAGHLRRIGPAIWQAMYFSLAAGLVLPLIAPLAGPLFRWVGHEARLQPLESAYFRIMILGAVAAIYNSAVSSLYTGLGRNWPLVWVNAGITLINIVLDYAMIFGHWGFPQWGIAGAAWATNIALACGSVAYTVMFLAARNQREFATREGWRPDRLLLRRLMRFGLPCGVQFTLDICAFNFFIFIVGRIGTIELAATSLAFQVNQLAFMPMIGIGIATSTLVGQWLGRNRPELAARATWSAFHLTFLYMASVAACYVLFPSVFIDPFASKSDPATFEAMRRLAVKILYFVAVYSLFDTMNLIFSSALKGAGDTHFVMVMSVSMAWSIMVLPTWLLCGPGRGGIFTAWTFLSILVIVLGFGFLLRFLNGRWRTMRVIELPARLPSPAEAETVK